ncbi:hypothetical protein LY76DRAFT_360291 [Colletotrichum caudatum]|nr:hypothetical protein LY76DRAFT_360291 [Colletotrichum caudatum]
MSNRARPLNKRDKPPPGTKTKQKHQHHQNKYTTSSTLVPTYTYLPNPYLPTFKVPSLSLVRIPQILAEVTTTTTTTTTTTAAAAARRHRHHRHDHQTSQQLDLASLIPLPISRAIHRYRPHRPHPSCLPSSLPSPLHIIVSQV